MIASCDRVSGQYILGRSGKIFLLDFEQQRPARGGIVIVPPFAEEMNRSRKLLSRQARALAAAGYRVIFPDVYGTGDSHGEFSEARWSGWKDDIQLAISIASRDGALDVSCLAVRMGCLLAADTLRELAKPVSCTVMWSPQPSGRQALDQFFRLRAMATMLNQTRPRESVGELHSKLETDGSLEVAGYTIDKSMASVIRELDLGSIVSPKMGDVYWIEVSANATAPIPFAARRAVENCDSTPIELRKVVAPQYWSTPETVVPEELVAMTTNIFESRDG